MILVKVVGFQFLSDVLMFYSEKCVDDATLELQLSVFDSQHRFEIVCGM